jgi:hypothetical protein
LELGPVAAMSAADECQLIGRSLTAAGGRMH